MTLSKHLYTQGIQCSKLLWLQKHNRNVLKSQNSNTFINFETDNEIKLLAYKLFQNAVEIVNTSDVSQMISLTQKSLKNDVKTIYNATFKYEDIVINVDVLTKSEDGLSLYHIENSLFTDITLIQSLAVQYYVLKQLGYEIKDINNIKLNRLYQRGNTLEIRKLFKIHNITNKVIQLEDETITNLAHFKTILTDQNNEPNIDIGKHCDSHHSCEAEDYCWRIQKKIPEYSIFNIFKLGSKKQKQLYSKGIVKIEDIPNSFWMTAKQEELVEHYKLKEQYANKEAIKTFLDTLNYPIYHFFCNSFHHAIPNFKESNPYEEIPFQYSIHIEHENGKIEYKEYLSPDDIDPRYEFTRKLCEDIPQDATVLGYNINSIQNILKNLASPYSARSEHLHNINKNMKDLMMPFEEKHIVSPSMKGYYDKRTVVQSFLPEIESSYSKLEEIENNKKVLHIFPKMNKMEKAQKEKTRDYLKEYSKLNSLSSVKILEKLKEL